MKIKKLIEICEQAIDKNREVYIPGYDGQKGLDVGYNYDDNCDLDLYVISGEDREEVK